MYFKSDLHESLFFDIIQQLKLGKQNKQYEVFAYMAAATEKQDIVQAFSQHDIEIDTILEQSETWSLSEKYLIELGFQFFNGSNFYYELVERDPYNPVDVPPWIEDEKRAKYPSFGEMLGRMDGENVNVIISAIRFISK